MIFISIQLIILTSFFQPQIKADDSSYYQAYDVVLFDGMDKIDFPKTVINLRQTTGDFIVKTMQKQCIAYYSGKERYPDIYGRKPFLTIGMT